MTFDEVQREYGITLDDVETLDELQDWLTAQNPQIIDELREARRQDLAREFKP
jgi:hypothetical protein